MTYMCMSLAFFVFLVQKHSWPPWTNPWRNWAGALNWACHTDKTSTELKISKSFRLKIEHSCRGESREKNQQETKPTYCRDTFQTPWKCMVHHGVWVQPDSGWIWHSCPTTVWPGLARWHVQPESATASAPAAPQRSSSPLDTSSGNSGLIGWLIFLACHLWCSADHSRQNSCSHWPSGTDHCWLFCHFQSFNRHKTKV